METELTKKAFLCFSDTLEGGLVSNYIPCFCDNCNGNRWVIETIHRNGYKSYHVVYVSMPMLVLSSNKKVKLGNTWLDLPKKACIVDIVKSSQ